MYQDIMQPAKKELSGFHIELPSSRNMQSPKKNKDRILLEAGERSMNLTNTSREDYIIETIQDISMTNTDQQVTERDNQSRQNANVLTNRSRLSGPSSINGIPMTTVHAVRSNVPEIIQGSVMPNALISPRALSH